MMHITEDTPPDMLAGAMDLTVHLPNGRSVKMSVERSTPMMDVLVQITTAHHLQLSGYVIEALGMAPSSEHSDKILPYKPNTPIGTLDTQHIRVVPKARSLPAPKNVPPGHQPFESTFRLKVHLPRKQLFVSRVSMNVHLEDIMGKVCDEKNLDPVKYEFRHPENLDEVLDPKLTLSDYQITEVYVVSKGSSRLSQAFSASDIMALRKDEERKQSKSSGVFNLIFKRGKTSNGSGSLSSDNRSISPTHSDDSRSVTPPVNQQKIEKPKAPLRKRRPAPKPPQIKEENSNEKKKETTLTICHSRNSSDSSGYHEASILSDNVNTTLPRRPQTMLITEEISAKLNGEHSKSTSNLTAMSNQSKSTSSLAFAGRKKKAPPPPPVLKSASSATNLEKASPVVASPVEKQGKLKSYSHANITPKQSDNVFKSLNPLSKSDSEILDFARFDSKSRIASFRRKFSDKLFKSDEVFGDAGFASSLKRRFSSKNFVVNAVQSDAKKEGQFYRKFHNSLTRKWSRKFENSLEVEFAPSKSLPNINKREHFFRLNFRKKKSHTVDRASVSSNDFPTSSYRSFKDVEIHSPGTPSCSFKDLDVIINSKTDESRLENFKQIFSNADKGNHLKSKAKDKGKTKTAIVGSTGIFFGSESNFGSDRGKFAKTEISVEDVDVGDKNQGRFMRNFTFNKSNSPVKNKSVSSEGKQFFRLKITKSPNSHQRSLSSSNKSSEDANDKNENSRGVPKFHFRLSHPKVYKDKDCSPQRKSKNLGDFSSTSQEASDTTVQEGVKDEEENSEGNKDKICSSRKQSTNIQEIKTISNVNFDDEKIDDLTYSDSKFKKIKLCATKSFKSKFHIGTSNLKENRNSGAQEVTKHKEAKSVNQNTDVQYNKSNEDLISGDSKITEAKKDTPKSFKSKFHVGALNSKENRGSRPLKHEETKSVNQNCDDGQNNELNKDLKQSNLINTPLKSDTPKSFKSKFRIGTSKSEEGKDDNCTPKKLSVKKDKSVNKNIEPGQNNELNVDLKQGDFKITKLENSPELLRTGNSKIIENTEFQTAGDDLIQSSSKIVVSTVGTPETFKSMFNLRRKSIKSKGINSTDHTDDNNVPSEIMLEGEAKNEIVIRKSFKSNFVTSNKDPSCTPRIKSNKSHRFTFKNGQDDKSNFFGVAKFSINNNITAQKCETKLTETSNEAQKCKSVSKTNNKEVQKFESKHVGIKDIRIQYADKKIANSVKNKTIPGHFAAQKCEPTNDDYVQKCESKSAVNSENTQIKFACTDQKLSDSKKSRSNYDDIEIMESPPTAARRKHNKTSSFKSKFSFKSKKCSENSSTKPQRFFKSKNEGELPNIKKNELVAEQKEFTLRELANTNQNEFSNEPEEATLRLIEDNSAIDLNYEAASRNGKTEANKFGEIKLTSQVYKDVRSDESDESWFECDSLPSLQDPTDKSALRILDVKIKKFCESESRLCIDSRGNICNQINSVNVDLQKSNFEEVENLERNSTQANSNTNICFIDGEAKDLLCQISRKTNQHPQRSLENEEHPKYLQSNLEMDQKHQDSNLKHEQYIQDIDRLHSNSELEQTPQDKPLQGSLDSDYLQMTGNSVKIKNYVEEKKREIENIISEINSENDKKKCAINNKDKVKRKFNFGKSEAPKNTPTFKGESNKFSITSKSPKISKSADSLENSEGAKSFIRRLSHGKSHPKKVGDKSNAEQAGEEDSTASSPCFVKEAKLKLEAASKSAGNLVDGNEGPTSFIKRFSTHLKTEAKKPNEEQASDSTKSSPYFVKEAKLKLEAAGNLVEGNTSFIRRCSMGRLYRKKEANKSNKEQASKEDSSESGPCFVKEGNFKPDSASRSSDNLEDTPMSFRSRFSTHRKKEPNKSNEEQAGEDSIKSSPYFVEEAKLKLEAAGNFVDGNMCFMKSVEKLNLKIESNISNKEHASKEDSIESGSSFVKEANFQLESVSKSADRLENTPMSFTRKFTLKEANKSNKEQDSKEESGPCVNLKIESASKSADHLDESEFQRYGTHQKKVANKSNEEQENSCNSSCCFIKEDKINLKAASKSADHLQVDEAPSSFMRRFSMGKSHLKKEKLSVNCKSDEGIFKSKGDNPPQIIGTLAKDITVNDVLHEAEKSYQDEEILESALSQNKEEDATENRELGGDLPKAFRFTGEKNIHENGETAASKDVVLFKDPALNDEFCCKAFIDKVGTSNYDFDSKGLEKNIHKSHVDIYKSRSDLSRLCLEERTTNTNQKVQIGLGLQAFSDGDFLNKNSKHLNFRTQMCKQHFSLIKKSEPNKKSNVKLSHNYDFGNNLDVSNKNIPNQNQRNKQIFSTTEKNKKCKYVLSHSQDFIGETPRNKVKIKKYDISHPVGTIEGLDDIIIAEPESFTFQTRAVPNRRSTSLKQISFFKGKNRSKGNFDGQEKREARRFSIGIFTENKSDKNETEKNKQQCSKLNEIGTELKNNDKIKPKWYCKNRRDNEKQVKKRRDEEEKEKFRTKHKEEIEAMNTKQYFKSFCKNKYSQDNKIQFTENQDDKNPYDVKTVNEEKTENIDEKKLVCAIKSEILTKNVTATEEKQRKSNVIGSIKISKNFFSSLTKNKHIKHTDVTDNCKRRESDFNNKSLIKTLHKSYHKDYEKQEFSTKKRNVDQRKIKAIDKNKGRYSDKSKTNNAYKNQTINKDKMYPQTFINQGAIPKYYNTTCYNKIIRRHRTPMDFAPPPISVDYVQPKPRSSLLRKASYKNTKCNEKGDNIGRKVNQNNAANDGKLVQNNLIKNIGEKLKNYEESEPIIKYVTKPKLIDPMTKMCATPEDFSLEEDEARNCITTIATIETNIDNEFPSNYDNKRFTGVNNRSFENATGATNLCNEFVGTNNQYPNKFVGENQRFLGVNNEYAENLPIKLANCAEYFGINPKDIHDAAPYKFTEITDEIFIDPPESETKSKSKPKLATTRNFPNRKFTKGQNIKWESNKSLFNKLNENLSSNRSKILNPTHKRDIPADIGNKITPVPKPRSKLREDKKESVVEIDSHRKSLGDKSNENYVKALETIHVDLFNNNERKISIPLFPKATEEPTNHFDTLTRRRGFGIGQAMLSIDSEESSLNDKAEQISLASTNSALDLHDDLDDMSDVNTDIFERSAITNSSTSSSVMDELVGIHCFDAVNVKIKKQQSASSLRSIDSVPGCMRKWNNVHDLDEISLVSGDLNNTKWVIGDSDSESREEKIIAAKNVTYTTNSPPESIASSVATTLSSNIETDINLSKENSEIVENEKKLPVLKEIKVEVESEDKPRKEEELETDWQYQLPSPPTAFRDSSPTIVETNYESTEKYKPDSVVTSPELFEKLQLVKEAQSDITPSDVTRSEITSVISEEEKPIFNKLSLENLEKRKSLVYNRELATSLKYKDDESKAESVLSKRSSVLSELEEVISNPASRSSTLNKPAVKPDNFIHSAADSTLPNFKITTYDMPKKKINIFEDDSIRSNAENKIPPPAPTSNLIGTFGKSMENISYKKTNLDEGFKKPQEFNKYRAKTLARTNTEGALGRSESFSSNNWVPANPVKRSKSQVAINQYKDERKLDGSDGDLSKSNSLFDVSGLQSLEVMRLIQTKLNTPCNSTEQLDKKEDIKEEPDYDEVDEKKEEVVPKPAPYQYRGPPSINLGTWSDRPKSQISLKEDTDYKFNTNSAKSNPGSCSIRVNGVEPNKTGNVSIKVNGSEPISTQSSGNVIIKIGSSDKKERFINHTAVGYRKPLGNINKVEKPQRPHSIAYESNFDISRVPIVRSVELKKPYKDMQINNTSITQIYQKEDESKSLNYYSNSESINRPVVRINSFSQNTPVVKGFDLKESKMIPTYKTLPSKSKATIDNFTTNQNVPFSQIHLRRTDSTKNNQSNTNNNIFSNVVLRNTSNSYNNNRYASMNGRNVEKPPPPPVMPKIAQRVQPARIESPLEARDELLSAIRNFGGKKGLKSVKV